MTEEKNKISWNILTIPNILSMLRVAMIPIIARLYFDEEYYGAVGVMILSGITDIIDGFVARKFNMTSNLGKILDPVADKLTQGLIILCLAIRYPYMLIIFGLMAIKELVLSIVGIMAIKKTQKVKSANWHGKITTFLLYANIIAHILWVDIPKSMSYSLVGICLVFIILSFCMYFSSDIGKIKESNQINNQ